MVKPSKSMQPEHVDLQEASKRIGKGAAFGEDSFRNYMAMKIAMQRQQFGLILPPPPQKSQASKQKASPPPPPPKRKEISDGFETGRDRKRILPNVSTPTNRHHPANPDNPAFAGVLPSPNQTMNLISSASKRPTLLDRISSAPLSQVAYGPSPLRPESDGCLPSDRSVRFADDPSVGGKETKQPKSTNNSKNTKMESVISRLKKRHGRGNRRLERKKRKIERSSDNQIKGNRATNVKTDSLLESPKQEDGLKELEKLFAIADENDMEFVSESDEHNNESKSYSAGEAETETKPTFPVASINGNEERKLTPVIRDGLAELDKMFAAAEAATNDGFSSSPCNHLLESEHHQQGSLAELDRKFSVTGVANDDGDHHSVCFDTDGPEEIFQTSPEKQHDAANDDHSFCFETNESWEKNQTSPKKQYDTANRMELPIMEEEDEEESSIPSTEAESVLPPSPKSIRRLRPDLFFYGIVVKVAGYTHPDNETLKRLLQKHGGDLETYETERVTHIIAQQLSMAKANVYKKARRPRPVCRPSWIMDSVREGKLLPHGNYLLIEDRDQQQMGIQTMFKKHTQTSRKEPPTNSNLPLSPQKSAMIHKNPYAKKNNSIHSPEKRDRDSFSVGETAQSSTARHDHHSNHGSPPTTDRRLIDGKVRTVGTDPNFLDSYFASSRLSFIGSFKQRAPHIHHSNGNGSSLSLSNSKKLIFHVDMDCFFASVVLRNYPQYQDKPVVISHHGNRSNDQRKDNERGNNTSHGHVPKNSSSECATCNYEARKYGIKKGMFLGRAKELCPKLIVLMYDFEGYEEVSQQVLEILDRLASSESHPGVVETVSCDEAYVELNFDSSEDSKKLHDHAIEVAESIRNEIFDKTRCTASIGVGANKFLAKLGTDKAKPNKSYFVRDYRELLRELNLRDMHGVGWRTEKKLTEEGLISVQDVWDLGGRGETELVRILGPVTGKKIYHFTQGKDDRPITAAERKTIGAECNYGVRFDGPYGIDHFMEGLAKEVEKRMEGIFMKGKKLTLKIKQRKKGAGNKHKFLGHGSCHNLSKSIVIPGNVGTRDSKIFKKTGLILFKEFGIADIHEIRGMGVTISNLEADSKSEKQTITSGMQNWLHRSNEPEISNNSETIKDTTMSKRNVSGSPFMTNDGVSSSPNQEKMLEVDKGAIVAEEEFRNEESLFKVQLPPVSQIHMSQVQALPPELQKEVRSRLKEDVAGNLEGGKFQQIVNPGIDRDESIVEIAETPIKFFGEELPNGDNILQSTPRSIGELINSAEKDSDRNAFKSVESPLLIELPPMSQIQMTQVEALPDELKAQVYSRMNRMAADVGEREIVDMTNEDRSITHAFTEQHVPVETEQQHSANRFRQTNLKRMMKLAAVQSGHERTNISLTQLDQLPLEIKLQVVNGDDQQIGILSQHVHRSASSSDRPPRKSISSIANNADNSCSKTSRRASNYTKNTGERRKTPDANITIKATTAEKKKNSPQESTREFRIIDRVDVWKEDLLPLKEFLNDNCPLRFPNSIDMVLEFLSIVLKEGRLPAMVSMIRCIRNRKDEWSKMEIIKKIALTVNDLHIQRYGASLDVPWLMGVEESLDELNHSGQL